MQSTFENDLDTLDELKFIRKYYNKPLCKIHKQFLEKFNQIKSKYFKCKICKNVFKKPSVNGKCNSEECQNNILNIKSDFNHLSELEFIKKYFHFKPLDCPKDFRKTFIDIKSKYFKCIICDNVLLKPSLKKACSLEECQEKADIYFQRIISKAQQTCLEKYDYKNPFEVPIFKEKIRKTNLKNLGVEYAMQSLEVQEKSKQTNLKNLGVGHPMQSQEIKEKMRQTNLKNLGVEYAMQSLEVKKKSKESCLKNYGVENPMLSLEIKEKLKQTSLAIYGVEHPMQSQEIKEKIKQGFIRDYGVDNPNQSHLKNYKDLNREFFIENFIDSDGFFNVEKCMDYFNFKYSCALSHKRKFNIPNPNRIEKCKTQTYLFNNIKLENKLYNDKKVLNGLELDIFLPDFNLAIEFNGLMYHSAGISEYSVFNKPDFPEDYHLNKLELCKSKGIKLLHIFEGEDLDLWLSMINGLIGFNQVILESETTIKPVDSEESDNFLSENHILGSEKSDINLGLYHGNKLLLIMTFNVCSDCYELIRFGTKKNTTISGGFSKVFNYFIGEYKPKKILAKLNRRLSNAEILLNLGFTLKSKTKPNHFFFNPKELILKSHSNYSMNKIQSLYNDKILNYFNTKESEKINMLKNGFRCIYDCGDLILEYEI